MVVISLNEVHVWWKVGCLLGCWIIVGLSFCSILEGYYSFPDDPDFRRLWVCSGLSLIFISYHYHLRMSEAGLFPPVRYFLRKPEELFRLSQKYPSLHVFSNIKMIVIMQRTLVRIDIRKMFHLLQLNANFINFAFYMLVGIVHSWLTKLTNDRNNR